MSEQSEVRAARDNVLQKIGRNVVAFQKMEAMVKFLIANHKIEGVPDQLQRVLAKNVAEVERKTFGSLIDQLFRTTFTADSGSRNESETLDAAWSVSFSVDLSAEGAKETKAALRLIVQERNALIHQMLVTFDPTSLPQCMSLSSTLDVQLENLKPQYENLRTIVKTVIDGRKELLAFIDSEAFQVEVSKE